MGDVEELSASAILRGLRTEWLGRRIAYFDVIGSTNDEAKRLAEGGAPAGALVIADQQTAGRGRMARCWLAPAGSSLLLSIILRPPLPPARAQLATMACGLAAAEAIEEATGAPAELKWPNDVLIGGRKVAGILTEMGTRGERLDYLVAGIGINVNLDPAALLEAEGADRAALEEALRQDPSLRGVARQATSLMIAAGRPVSRLKLLQRFLEKLEARHAAIARGKSPYQEWARRMSLLNQEVEVVTPAEILVGQAVGLDPDGALIVRTPDGVERRILAGDLRRRE